MSAPLETQPTRFVITHTIYNADVARFLTWIDAPESSTGEKLEAAIRASGLAADNLTVDVTASSTTNDQGIATITCSAWFYSKLPDSMPGRDPVMQAMTAFWKTSDAGDVQLREPAADTLLFAELESKPEGPGYPKIIWTILPLQGNK